MNTLVVYDNDGFIYQQLSGDYKKPNGLPYLEVIIPEKHFIVGVDVSEDKHKVIFETHPPTETEILKAKSAELEETVSYLFTEVIPMLMSINTPPVEEFPEEPYEEPSEGVIEEPVEESTEGTTEPYEEPVNGSEEGVEEATEEQSVDKEEEVDNG